ncbi:MAG: multicopper oxidase domain-containing protein [Solirubrobacteraceae bacterium]
MGVTQKLGHRRRLGAIGALLVMACAAWLIFGRADVRATSGGDPYSAPSVVDTNPDPNIVETTITAENANVDVGNGVIAHAETFNGSIPGPTFHLKVGDTVIVHYNNNLARASAIHWHGIELANEMDGTPFTQQQVLPGHSFLYKFKVDRPGIFWYHPHHHASTDQVFRGLYGMIVVTDPNEPALQASGTLPSAANTKQLVLSDTTVCKAPGTNDTATYNPSLPWVGGGALPPQLGPTPKTLCEAPTAIDDDGSLRPNYAAGDIPAIQHNTGAPGQPTNEGQTVLTNGKNVGGRAGSPSAPGALASGASTLNVQPGQGVRLQLVNASAVRYMRLRLSKAAADPNPVPLVRVGGEGGLLDSAVVEGGVIAGFDTLYTQGEILLPPGSRADVVAAIPAAPTTGTLTLWTEDYSRTGMTFTNIPTVPVMHLNLAGPVVSPAYSISDGTPLRAATGNPVPVLGPATSALLNPATFSPPKLGMSSQTIALQSANPLLHIDGAFGTHDVPNYETAAHLGSTRYAKVGDILELSVSNATGANHPFHLHGFSIQPLDLKSGATTYTFPHEFRDNVDIPPGYTLRFRLQITDRPLTDGVTPGGAYGRWLFHCHIFFHATLGMLSELVVVPASGKERPDINVDASQVQVNQGQTAQVTGTYFDPNSDHVNLSSSVGTVVDNGGGNFKWSLPTGAHNSQFVYLTATDSNGLKSQIPFFLKIVNVGPPALVLPNGTRANFDRPVSFGIRATDPDPVDVLSLGAAGLPRGLSFHDNHNRTGSVSGTVTARPGTYTTTFSASDGHNGTTHKALRITITQAALTALIGDKVRPSHGAITVGCLVRTGSVHTCTVTALLGRKVVGKTRASRRRHGKRTINLRVRLSSATLNKIAHSRNGVKLKIQLVVTRFGVRGSLKTAVTTTAVKR